MHEQCSAELLARFWARVDRAAGAACWEWLGGLNHYGYGIFNLGRRGVKTGAHRFAYRALRGPIPDGMLVLHACDNRRCVRPDHLFLGDHALNSADMVGKLRSARGERHSQHKLSAASVAAIRALLDGGVLSKAAIARRFGVSRPGINHIAYGATWRE